MIYAILKRKNLKEEHMTAKKYSLATIITYLLVYLSPIIIALIVRPTQNQNITMTTLAYIIGALLLLIYLFKSQKFKIEQKPKAIGWMILFGFLGIFGSILLQNILLMVEQAIFNAPTASQNTENIIQLIQDNMVFILATTIAGPIMEELVFRRAIFGALQNKWGFFLPALISSALFAAAHVDGHYLLYGGLGLFFCFLYRYTGRIGTSMITHVGMNLLVIIVQLAARQAGLV